MRPPNRAWFLALIALAGPTTGVAAAQGPIDDSQPKAQEASATDAAAEAVQAIIKKHREAYDGFLEVYRAAETEEAKQKAVDDLLPDGNEYAGGLWEIVEANPGSEASLDAIVWIAQNAGSMQNSERALEAVAMYYMDDERASDILQRVYLTEKCLEPAQAILEGSESDANRCHACFALANYWKAQSEAAYTNNDALLAKAEAYLVRVTDEFADVPGRRGTMGAEAELQLFEIRNLAIGRVAPDIVGVDVEGHPRKLSDYRGKVVVLDFWGDW